MATGLRRAMFDGGDAGSDVRVSCGTSVEHSPGVGDGEAARRREDEGQRRGEPMRARAQLRTGAGDKNQISTIAH